MIMPSPVKERSIARHIAVSYSIIVSDHIFTTLDGEELAPAYIPPKFRMNLTRTNIRSEVTTRAVRVQTKVATITTDFSSSLGFDFQSGKRHLLPPLSAATVCQMPWYGMALSNKRWNRVLIENLLTTRGRHCTICKERMQSLFHRSAGAAQQSSERPVRAGHLCVQTGLVLANTHCKTTQGLEI